MLMWDVSENRGALRVPIEALPFSKQWIADDFYKTFGI